MARPDRTEADRNLLLSAAHQAAIASEALMRAALEGEPVDDETMDKIADAARMLAEAEFDLDARDNADVVRFCNEAQAFLDGDWRA